MINKDFDLEDSFLVSEIIDKMDIELEIKEVMDSIKDKDIENIDEEALGKEMFLNLGIDLSYKAIKKLHKAKKEVKRLICSLTGKTMSEASKMSLKEIKDFFNELVKSEGFKDFLN